MDCTILIEAQLKQNPGICRIVNDASVAGLLSGRFAAALPEVKLNVNTLFCKLTRKTQLFRSKCATIYLRKTKGVFRMSEVSQETMMFKREPEKLNVAETIKEVYAALEKKGYNPVDQLAGYLLSGDPTYITSFEDARTKLRRHERYELIEELVKNYLQQINK